MKDRLYPFNGVRHCVVAADIAFYQFDIGPYGFEVPPPSGGEVVEYAHGVPLLEELKHYVRTDEPGTAGY